MIESPGVVLPAHNEERPIGASLHALRDSLDLVRIPVEVCVLADRCTDATSRRGRSVHAWRWSWSLPLARSSHGIRTHPAARK
jgi:hypothetical protein